MLEWFFTRTTTEDNNNIIKVNINNTDKYVTSGTRSQNLEVRNIISSDEGYYFCRVRRNGVLMSDLIEGTCLDVYSK